MAGPKTHQQQLRILERKDELAERDEEEAAGAAARAGRAPTLRNPEARQSEMPISRGGMNQESRAHNKHNRPPPPGRRKRSAR